MKLPYEMTPARVKSWRECRKQFWHKYVDRTAEARQFRSPAGIVGKAVHEGMRVLAETNDPELGRGEVLRYLRQPRRESAGPGTDYHDVAVACYDAGIEAHDTIDSIDVWVEQSSWAPFPEQGITAWMRADRVDKLRTGQYLLIDWKTGRIDNDQHTDLQLDIANVVMRRIRRVPAEAEVKAIGWNLRGNKQRTRELTAEDAHETVRYLSLVASRMQTEEQFEPNPGPHCRFCAWSPVCDVAQDFGLDNFGADDSTDEE
jgi:CRISPR/Cas system-associated exonuclease Cas4 (RecB family)